MKKIPISLREHTHPFLSSLTVKDLSKTFSRIRCDVASLLHDFWTFCLTKLKSFRTSFLKGDNANNWSSSIRSFPCWPLSLPHSLPSKEQSIVVTHFSSPLSDKQADKLSRHRLKGPLSLTHSLALMCMWDSRLNFLPRHPLEPIWWQESSLPEIKSSSRRGKLFYDPKHESDFEIISGRSGAGCEFLAGAL